MGGCPRKSAVVLVGKGKVAYGLLPQLRARYGIWREVLSRVRAGSGYLCATGPEDTDGANSGAFHGRYGGTTSIGKKEPPPNPRHSPGSRLRSRDLFPGRAAALRRPAGRPRQPTNRRRVRKQHRTSRNLSRINKRLNPSRNLSRRTLQAVSPTARTKLVRIYSPELTGLGKDRRAVITRVLAALAGSSTISWPTTTQPVR